MVGHFALVNSVIYGSFIHSFMIYKCPMVLLRFMEMMIRNFVWTGSTCNKKLVTVKWDDCFHPKEEGGLGIKRFHCLNSAMLYKLA